jgi:hypothetical protein
MPENPIDLTKLLYGAFDVSWKSAALGGVDNVTPNIKWITKDKMVGSLGPIVVGKRIVGLDINIVCEFREMTAARYKTLHAWHSGNGALNFAPEIGRDLYDYAGLLNLHPRELGSTLDLDLNFTKAVPQNVTPPKRNGGDVPDVVVADFYCFFDRSLVGGVNPILNYGYLGAPPPPPPP